MLSFVTPDTTAGRPAEGIVKRSYRVRRVVYSVLVMLSVTMIPTSLFAQRLAPDAAAVSIPSAAVALRPATVGPRLHLAVSGEGVCVGGQPPQRAGARDSLRNGALIGAVIGVAGLGALAATLCHLHRERGGSSCVPDTIRFAAIGGAIGLGAGIAIDVARSSSPMVRLTVAF
jgi:hypothetical protein